MNREFSRKEGRERFDAADEYVAKLAFRKLGIAARKTANAGFPWWMSRGRLAAGSLRERCGWRS
jgi:hypothetical protein